MRLAASLRRRRVRLRTTAVPTRLLIAYATRGGGPPGHHDTVIGPDRPVLASLSSAKPERPGDRHFKLPGGAGPSGGVL